MMHISEDYLKLNQQLHKNNAHWGSSAHRRTGGVLKCIEQVRPQSILDYGCGKGLLGKTIGMALDEYDPAIPGKDKLNKSSYDMVACIDVMEHVEPEYVDDVLNEINRLATKCAHFVIYLKPAVHSLPDGSNCHRTIQPAQWWVDKIEAIFGCESEHKSNHVELELTVIR